MEILAFICNLIGLGCVITASVIKGERIKTILLFVFLGNVLVSIAYLLDGSGFNAAASGLAAAAQTVINFLFESKGKPVPKWLIGIYAVMLIGINLTVGGFTWLSLLAIAACMTFILSIFQKNGRGYRLCILSNTLIWSTYDFLTHSWNGLLTHATVFLFTLVSTFIWDRKKKSDTQPPHT